MPVARPVFAVVRVIEVYQPQEVPEFVAEISYAGGYRGAVYSGIAPAQFGAASEQAYPHSVSADSLLADVVGLGPYSIVVSALGLIVSGQKEEHEVRLTVSVGIILTEIHLSIRQGAGFFHQLGQTYVVCDDRGCGRIILSVVGVRPAEPHRGGYVETELPPGHIGFKIVFGGAGPAVLLVAGCVEHPVKMSGGVVHREIQVLEFHWDYQDSCL